MLKTTTAALGTTIDELELHEREKLLPLSHKNCISRTRHKINEK
jgi:hypothetical protein